MSRVQNLVAKYKDDLAESTAKYERLQNLDLFVLDNSIPESTVGQLRGHTVEDKWAIYNEVKKMKFKDVIVASFSHMTRVDDVFIRELVEKGEDRSTLWAFSEVTEGKQLQISFIISSGGIKGDMRGHPPPSEALPPAS